MPHHRHSVFLLSDGLVPALVKDVEQILPENKNEAGSMMMVARVVK